jgi:hypothetical protein
VNSRNTFIHIGSSVFSSFISHAIHFSNAFHSMNTSHGERLSDLAEDGRIEHCRFSNIHSGDKTGGAIYSSASLSLFSCLFDSCSAAKGGAMASTGSLQLQYVTVLNCSAQEAGGFNVRTNSRDDMSVSLSLFVGCRAHMFGVCYRNSREFFKVWQTNITSCATTGCVAALEAKAGAVEFRWFVLWNSSSQAPNGGICVRELESLRVESSVFSECRHDGRDDDTAAVLLIYDGPWDGLICDSIFWDNDPAETSTVTVASGNHLKLTNCCFTGAEEKEISQRNYGAERCVFGAEACPTVFLKSIAEAGFDESGARKPATRVRKYVMAREIERLVVVKPGNQVVVWGASVGIGAVAIGLLAVFQAVVTRIYGGTLKVPKALQ